MVGYPVLHRLHHPESNAGEGDRTFTLLSNGLSEYYLLSFKGIIHTYMKYGIIVTLFIVFSIVIPVFAQLVPGEELFSEKIPQTSSSHVPTLIPVLVIPFGNYPGYAPVYKIQGITGDNGFMFDFILKEYDSIINQSRITPDEQKVLKGAIRNFTEDGFPRDSLLLYRILLNQRYSEDDFHFIDTSEVHLVKVIEGIPEETEVVGVYSVIDPQTRIIKKEYTNVTFAPSGNVSLVSPYTVFRHHADDMKIIPYSDNTYPVILRNINLGYYYNERPYNRGRYYEPVWIYRGLNRIGEPVTVFSWASKDRGTYPPEDDLDTAPVSHLIIHDGTGTHRVLQPGDPGFDVLHAEVREVLHSLYGECPCAIFPEQKVDQREKGSYVEVVFPEGAHAVVILNFDHGPWGMLENYWDGAIIAFQGPFGRKVFVLTHNEECNCTVWALHDSLRDTTILEKLAGISRGG